MARREVTEKASETIGRCSSLVRGVATSVDEIIWAINPRNDTLRYMVDYISHFAVEFLQAADIRCRIDLSEPIPDRTISPEARHHLFLAVKEALNNISRYAHATDAHLGIAIAERRLIIAVEDNGRGFETPPDNAYADGLRNMRQRMYEIGGEFHLDTKPGAGTRLSFVYRWPAGSAAPPDDPNMLPASPLR